MRWYRAKLEMQSWTASAWQSDTIFGHLCWGMRYLHGEKQLAAFLESYQGGSPPLLVSNGFPGDLLPKPVLPAVSVANALNQEEFDQNKRLKKISLLSQQEFARVGSGERISKVVQDRKDELERFETRRVTLKNQINRLTGTTGGEGQLFPFEEFYWQTVSIYLKVQDDFLAMARSLFDYMVAVGYGKRKSVGYGQIKKLDFEPFEGFASVPQANGFVSLSNFVPSQNDPTRGSWNTLVKYGKLGEEYAHRESPFKKPLLMLEAGSTFYDAPCREFYGRLVRNMSQSDENVVQYAFALPVPMRLP